MPIERSGDDPIEVVFPSGAVTRIESDNRFNGTDEPGIYQIRQGERSQPFAVNLSPTESRTAAIDADTLEQFGVALGVAETSAERQARERALRDVELEQRQKLWKWLVGGALALIALEMLLSGLRHRQSIAAGAST